MRIEGKITFSGSYAYDGALRIKGNELIFFKKSRAVRAFFGALGASLSTGKEVYRCDISGVESYSYQAGTFKDTVRFNFTDGSFIEFKGSSELKTHVLPLLASHSKMEDGTSPEQQKAPPMPKKFICSGCRSSFTGWYNECPNCKAKGTMRKATEADLQSM